MRKMSIPVLGAAVLLAATVFVPVQAAVDVDAAMALAKKSSCLKCHSAEKEKTGPSMKAIANKYRGKPDGVEKVIKSITEGQKFKSADGIEEEHKIIETKDPIAIRNMAEWYLSH